MATILEAKNRTLKAHKAACADSLRIATYDRWLADTLSAVKGKDEAIAEAMWTRLAIALEVMADMRGWAQGIVAGFTAPVRPRKLTHPRAGQGR
jgi:hypothetical protein